MHYFHDTHTNADQTMEITTCLMFRPIFDVSDVSTDLEKGGAYKVIQPLPFVWSITFQSSSTLAPSHGSLLANVVHLWSFIWCVPQ